MDELQIKVKKFYNELCPSAKTYLVIQGLFIVLTILIIILFKLKTPIFKEFLMIIPYGIWVIIHDSLCKYGWETISWILVTFIIITRPMTLYMKIKGIKF